MFELSSENADFAQVMVDWEITAGLTLSPTGSLLRPGGASLKGTTSTQDNRLAPFVPLADSYKYVSEDFAISGVAEITG